MIELSNIIITVSALFVGTVGWFQTADPGESPRAHRVRRLSIVLASVIVWSLATYAINR